MDFGWVVFFFAGGDVFCWGCAMGGLPAGHWEGTLWEQTGATSPVPHGPEATSPVPRVPAGTKAGPTPAGPHGEETGAGPGWGREVPQPFLRPGMQILHKHSLSHTETGEGMSQGEGDSALSRDFGTPGFGTQQEALLELSATNLCDNF